MERIIGRGMIPQFSTPDECYLTQSNMILKYNYKTAKLDKVCSVVSGLGGWQNFIKEKIFRNRIYRSYLSKNFGVNHVSVMNSSFLIAMWDKLYVHDFKDGYGEAKPVAGYQKFNIEGPLVSGVAAHEKSERLDVGE